MKKYGISENEARIFWVKYYVSILESVEPKKSSVEVIKKLSKEQKEETIDYKEDIIVVLDNVQDPGNIGTILRFF